MKKKTKKIKPEEELSDVLCEECGEAITKNRLKALPNTKRCIDCAEQREDTGEFVKTQMQIDSKVEGWEFKGVEEKIIKGD